MPYPSTVIHLSLACAEVAANSQTLFEVTTANIHVSLSGDGIGRMVAWLKGIVPSSFDLDEGGESGKEGQRGTGVQF